MKNTLKFIGLLLTTLILGSCGKETQSTTQGGGVFKVRVTIDPPLQPGATTTGGINFISIAGPSSIKSWIGAQQTSPLSTIETDEISVTSGQNVQFSISNFSNQFDFNCRTVKYEAIQNGKINEVHTVSLGYNGISSVCVDGFIVSKNFIMK